MRWARGEVKASEEEQLILIRVVDRLGSGVGKFLLHGSAASGRNGEESGYPGCDLGLQRALGARTGFAYL